MRDGDRIPLVEKATLALLASLTVAAQPPGCSSDDDDDDDAPTCAPLLLCQSPAIPDGHMCCTVDGNTNYWVGYLIAFGVNETPAGCVDTIAMAEQLGEASGKSYTIVRCEKK